MTTPSLLVTFLCLAATATADDQSSQETNSPKARLAALIAEYEATFLEYRNASRLANTKDEKDAALNHPGRNPAGFAPRFLEIAKEVPGTEVAEEALIWIGKNVPQGPLGEETRQLLLRDHIKSAKLKSALPYQSILAYTPSVETLMRKAIEQNPHRDVRGTAMYSLARVLKRRASGGRSPVKPHHLPEDRQRSFDIHYGPGWREVFMTANPVALENEAEFLFNRVITEYGDIPNEGASKRTSPLLRDLATQALQEPKR